MHKLKRVQWAFCAINVALFSQVNAAEKVDLSTQHQLSQQLFNAQLPSLQNQENSYKEQAQSLVPNGQKRTKYQQYFKGIPVYGASVVASTDKQGKSYDFIGQFIAKISDDIHSIDPGVDYHAALQLAVKADGRSLDLQALENTHGKLYVWLDEHSRAHLVWRVGFFEWQGKQPTSPHFIIDAHTGKVIKRWDDLRRFQPAKATGPGGNGATGDYRFGPQARYPALDIREENGVCTLDNALFATWDLKNKQGEPEIHSFACYDNDQRAKNGANSPLNDAHGFTQQTIRMYQERYDTRLYPEKIKIQVHRDVDLVGGFWNYNIASFGDGNHDYYPFTTLDVVAHELAHGFTSANAQLGFFGISGALDEAYSDMTAAAMHDFLNGEFSWKIGDELSKNGGFTRDMKNPVIKHIDDYSESAGQHANGGIFSLIFYRLATSEGWNIKQAFDVMTQANRLYWHVNTDFDNAGQGMYLAAKDYGYCVNDVVLALEAAGIYSSGVKDDSGCESDGNIGPQANFTYNAQDLVVAFQDTSVDDKGIVSYLWDFGDGATSAQSSPNYTFAKPGSHKVTLRVEDALGEVHVKVAYLSLKDKGCRFEQWGNDKVFVLGSYSAYENKVYRARWWTQGERPDLNSGTFGVWRFVQPCEG
ncbi:M4 family metallopeptidase [Pseudoalteromonas obscura]|uniref:Neutral metalloproteinase n=1 Tax=Pseudoalteromonas obscura TaxID=3048491 RepID=A0ABT7ELV5_9GAMM|nr:M4 family metallopeptidase [Pseudoalteromonas sp. P94(2023)]MDK2596047.1 M4 family metallopeptidase [Pseudoalteromonas sp. P94(2023)]